MVDRTNAANRIAQTAPTSTRFDTNPNKQLIDKFEKTLLSDNSTQNNGFIVSNQIITPNSISAEGGTSCDGKGGFEEVIRSDISDECGIRSCFVQHEQIHINQLEKNAPNICEGQTKGAALGYVDNATAAKYERPAYKDSINCLENKMDNASFLCKVELKLEAFKMPTAFEVLYREKL